jgi:hypothetical protein
MKHKQSLLMIVALCLIVVPSPGPKIHGFSSAAQTQFTEEQKQAFALFDKRVKEYLQQRERVRKQLPKLAKEAKPEEIQAYQVNFANALRAARVNAKPGDLFVPLVAEHIRKLIKTEYSGTERAQLRKTILEAETKGVPLRVNYPYPDSKEFSQIPPPLLLKLPQLPKEVKYRFVNYHLLLVDSDNDLIIDYMTKALP